MNDLQPTSEFRFKRGSSILASIKSFSSTEKMVFGALFVIAFVTALSMAKSASSNFMTEVPADGGSLREGVIGLPRTVNPVLMVTDVDRDLAALVYDGLMKYVDGKLVPNLAESYSISEDGLTYDFVLREDARFQDGKPLTAADVVFTVQKIQDPALKSPRRADWTDVTVTEISPTEVQFTLKQPYSPFLANTTVGIIPKHIWGTVSDDEFIFSQYNIEPIGAGPYRVASISRDAGGIPTEYRLTGWRGYHADAPHIDTVYFNFYADEEKALAALDRGEIDSLGSISAAPAAKLATDSAADYTVLSTPLPRIFGVFFNQNQNPVLADKVVRQALDMAVDRTALVDAVLSGYGVPIYGPVPAGMASSTTSAAASGTADLAGAQALLEKNGWKRNPETAIYEKKPAKGAAQTLALSLYTADTPDLKLSAEMVRDAWAELGVHVDLKIYESTDLYQNVIRPRKYDALLFGEQIGKDRDLYAFWHSSQRNAPKLNVAMYTNSKADKLLEDIRTTTDEAVRAEKYEQFDALVRADIPAIFLYSPEFIYVVPKALESVDLSSVTIPSDRWNSIGSWHVMTETVWKIFAKDQ